MASRATGWRAKAIARLGLAVLASTSFWIRGAESVATQGLEDADLKIPLWHWAFELRGAAGYKDNVTLSSHEPSASGFWLSHADAILFRVPTLGWRAHFFAAVDDVRYFDARGADNEQTALAAAEISKDFDHGWKSSLGLSYLYQNQFFDMSATYTNGGSIGLIRGHLLSPHWSGRKTLGTFWVEAEFAGARQILAAPLDNYWQLGPRLRLGLNYGRASEIALACTWTHQTYDTRECADLAGSPLPGKPLLFQTPGAELAWTHLWDDRKRWQTSLRLGAEATRDNGPGYYDYDLYRVQPELRYRHNAWELTARAGVRFFTYKHQTVSASDAARRQRTLLTVAARVERQLTRHLKAHASYQLERSSSNLDFDDYVANTMMGGLALEF
mgnify:CR=1 FL=1